MAGVSRIKQKLLFKRDVLFHVQKSGRDSRKENIIEKEAGFKFRIIFIREVSQFLCLSECNIASSIQFGSKIVIWR